MSGVERKTDKEIIFKICLLGQENHDLRIKYHLSNDILVNDLVERSFNWDS